MCGRRWGERNPPGAELSAVEGCVSFLMADVTGLLGRRGVARFLVCWAVAVATDTSWAGGM